jgi:hypothetical protein
MNDAPITAACAATRRPIIAARPAMGGAVSCDYGAAR